MHLLLRGAALRGVLILGACLAGVADAGAQSPSSAAETYSGRIRPLVARYCVDCHQGEDAEAELDLAAFADLEALRERAETWQKVAEMLDSRQMPPPDADQPSDAERSELHDFVHGFLKTEARRRACDPGPVVLRRLNNAEYTYVVRDLTGVGSLTPAAEFPVDGAAGEGFTNAGAALAMSPALLDKYLAAAKGIAEHAVLVPDGVRFSPSTMRRDWTEEALAEIRALYARYSASQGATQVNLQGVVFDTNGGGRLPLTEYLAALLTEREALQSGARTPGALAAERRLSPKYLGLLWSELGGPTKDDAPPSILLDGLRTKFRDAPPTDAAALAADVARWQQALWKFSSVGHIGKVGGPKAWMEPIDPLAARQEIRLPLPAPDAQGVVTIYLAATDAGDGAEGDFAVWERPRLTAPGRADLPLRDVRSLTQKLLTRRGKIFAQAVDCLAAANEAASRGDAALDVQQFAERRRVAPEALAAWLEYLGVDTGGAAKIAAPLARQATDLGGHAFVRGWVGDDALSIVANSSDEHVRIPGNMPAHGIGVHPSPTQQMAVGWRSPQATTLAVSGSVTHAHPECGNGVAWSLELRRGSSRQTLAQGSSQGGAPVPFGPLENLAVREGDLIVLAIAPRDGNHSCDLTNIDLTLRGAEREWNLSREVSPDILAGNPHADAQGTPGVWTFFSEPAGGPAGPVIPAGSLVARWQAAPDDAKPQLAAEIAALLAGDGANLAADSPDALLRKQLTSLGGPLLSAALASLPAEETATAGQGALGLDPAQFGRHPNGSSIDAESLCVQAPSVIEVRLPGELVAGAEFVAAATLHSETGREGSVQMQVTVAAPAGLGLQASAAQATTATGTWTDNTRGVLHQSPILTADGSAARQRFAAAFNEFRDLFPAALCYTKIVPVDEVITLVQFHREDEPLRRLMLADDESARLDRAWAELRYVSQDALTMVDAFEQLWQYATQDADPSAFEPLREPIEQRAAEFRQQLVASEPQHLDAVVRLAQEAYRRPLREAEARDLRQLYATLRSEELPHEAAIRMLIARVLVSPAFLYRLEAPGAVADRGAAAPLSDWELATRLSFFLNSAAPDAELREAAAQGRLQDPEVVAAQARRLLADARVRRLATEFGCQWLHVYDFAAHDEKSEEAFPTFGGLRGAMHEEVVAFMTDWFQRDGSILELLDADTTLVNEPLAQHYGIEGVSGPEFRRVEGLKARGRGGLLGWAATLSKQSGASRTSPILRGNWVCEVLLGEKLPKPPAGVPQLPETPPEGLTERQLIERHTTEAACAKCHQRIDPYGFALEGFDAIGRARSADVRARLPDGTEVEGLAGLRSYLLNQRRDDFVRQFCRKLLGYALGRSVQLSDEPLLDDMQSALTTHDYRIGVAVEQIVRSPQFRSIRAGDALAEIEPRRHGGHGDGMSLTAEAQRRGGRRNAQLAIGSWTSLSASPRLRGNLPSSSVPPWCDRSTP